MSDDLTIKVLAMYLPQFHQVKENDEWWGEGYTEWTAVRQATPLFEGHDQPKVPYNNYYYNLLDSEVMAWQSKLAHNYCIDGFVFYHYWFGYDRKILEKPAELLMENVDIDMPFCFCWDPYSWKRTWSKLQGNAWAPKFDNKCETTDDKELLVEQDFGDEDAWIKHIEYLIPFFEDKRYIRYDNKPVFGFISVSDIPNIDDMLSVWRKRLKDHGIEGLYVFSANVNDAGSIDSVIDRMRFGGHALYDNEGVCCYSYDELWKENLLKSAMNKRKTYWHGVVDYDDTPRRGKYGSVYLGGNPDKFKKYFSLLVRKSIESNNKFVFIDAWNEWGEGMYLEPDMRYEYRYLETIREIMSMQRAELFKYTEKRKISLEKEQNNDMSRLSDLLEVYRQRYQVMKLWATERLYKNCLDDYLSSKGYMHIAIYGYGNHGKMLKEELDLGTVSIEYVIDKRKNIEGSEGVNIYLPDDEFPDADLIIVTVVEEYEAIKNTIKQRTDVPIMSLRAVLEEALMLSGLR